MHSSSESIITNTKLTELLLVHVLDCLRLFDNLKGRHTRRTRANRDGERGTQRERQREREREEVIAHLGGAKREAR